MSFSPPESFNMVDYFLDDRVREGKGALPALHTDDGVLTYDDVARLANRFGNLLRDAGVRPEERVLIALPDGPEFVGALFGTLKIGAVVVMVNPELPGESIDYFYRYTRAAVAVVHEAGRAAFATPESAPPLLVVGGEDFDRRLAAAGDHLETFATHRDDAAIWLFSGGTTGRPKGVVQTHTSFANTTECYAKHVLGYREDDVTISVPKLFFGYATGSNLLFPFAAGASAVLFPERCTADVLFAKIEAFRPTLLINVPTMVNHLVSHPDAASRDLSSLRLSTSAGEALPVELYERWKKAFGVELLDGLGTAEMWHIFLSNRPDAVRPGTLGTAVPGFEVKVCDDEGAELADGEVGWLWVRGNSRAIGYWQQMDKTKEAFRGDWYVSGDMIVRDGDGFFTYCGRGDDMLKVSGKWLAPGEVENCLLEHPAVEEVAVVGVSTAEGLTKPHAFVVAAVAPSEGLAEELKAFVRERLEPYKYPREVSFLDDLPRTHLGKVDRGALKQLPAGQPAAPPTHT